MLMLGCVAARSGSVEEARPEPESGGPTVPSGRSGREATRGRAIRNPGPSDFHGASDRFAIHRFAANLNAFPKLESKVRTTDDTDDTDKTPRIRVIRGLSNFDYRIRPRWLTAIPIAQLDQEQPASTTPEATAPAEAPPKELSPEEKAALAEGQALFRGLCSGCHGGLGRGGKGPDLTDNRWLHGDKDEDIKRVIQNGVPGTTMKKLGESLKEQQITRIIAYVRSLARAPGDSNWKPYMPGDHKAGEQLFFDDKSKTPCSKCHTVNRKGGRVGPALDRIAARRSPEFIMESIVTPSKFIDPLFEAVSVATRDGKVIVGLRINETNFSIQLREENGRFHSLMKRDLEEFRVMDKSLMPENIPEQMTVKQLHDLFAFLMTLE